MKTLFPSLALLLAPALAASIPIAALPSSAFQIPISEALTDGPSVHEAGHVDNSDIPSVVPDGTMGPLLPGQCWASQCSPEAAQADKAKAEASAFSFSETAAKEAAKSAKGGAKDPFLPDGMRWKPGCAHQGPPCAYEPDPSKVGPNDLVLASAGGEKIFGTAGPRPSDAARREAERQRQADPNGQYDVTGLGGMRRPTPPSGAGLDDGGASTVAGLIVDGWNQMGFGDAGSGTGPSSQQPNVVKGAHGDIVQVEASWETVQQSRGGLVSLERDAGRQISLLEKVAGAGAGGISSGNDSAEDGTQGCQRGAGGDMTPCLGVSNQ